jgi:3-phenylpropionate/trans-cinnamate dioxygenase ferredoxin reductase subunit
VTERTFVVVGANLAGGAAVRTLRDEGFDGRIILIGDEPEPPYERPPLSKAYLRGEDEEPTSLLPEPWYAEQGIELRLGVRARRIDLDARAVELEEGERVRFDALLLATGGRPRELPGVPRSERITYLRRIADADRIRGHLGPGRRLAIVGAGFIGTEVAASARMLGTEVTLIDPGTAPLKRALGPEMGGVVAGIHRDHGVELRLGASVEGVEEAGGAVRVGIEDGEPVEADAAVIGIGMVPNVELATEAGLEVDGGIAADAAGRTSAEGVHAAGDVARHDHPLFGPIRIEHYDNALKMGAAVARTMLGSDEPFDDPHWFWSDQYDVQLQMAGVAMRWDELVVRGSVPERDFTAFYLHEGVLLSALSIGRPKDVRRAMKLIGARPGREALRDEGLDLRSLT